MFPSASATRTTGSRRAPTTSADDANDGDYSMFWLLHPEDYDDVRKIIDDAHLLGEETVDKPGWSDPGSDDD